MQKKLLAFLECTKYSIKLFKFVFFCNPFEYQPLIQSVRSGNKIYFCKSHKM